MEIKRRDFKDINFTVLADIQGDHVVNYKVFEITSVDDKGDIRWSKKGAECSPSFVSELKEAEVFMHGGVKWDGCSNWHIDEQDNAMLHGCCRDDLTRIGEVMARCWDWTITLCPAWDN